jgi:hypothetical protein
MTYTPLYPRRPWCPPHIVSLKFGAERRVWLEYADGTAGNVDLSFMLDGPCFERLRKDDTFFQLGQPWHATIRWPDGSDIAPELLYERAKETPLLLT